MIRFTFDPELMKLLKDARVSTLLFYDNSITSFIQTVYRASPYFDKSLKRVISTINNYSRQTTSTSLEKEVVGANSLRSRPRSTGKSKNHTWEDMSLEVYERLSNSSSHRDHQVDEKPPREMYIRLLINKTRQNLLPLQTYRTTIAFSRKWLYQRMLWKEKLGVILRLALSMFKSWSTKRNSKLRRDLKEKC